MIERGLRITWSLAVLAVPLAASNGQSAAAPRLGDDVAWASTAETAPSGNALHTRVRVDLQNVTIEAALTYLERQSGVPIMFGRNVIPAERRVSIRRADISLGAALDEILSGTLTEVSVTPKGQIVVSPASMRAQASGTITGNVRNAKTKASVAGATVLLDESTRGVLTDEDGAFRIPASAGEHTVMVRGIGFAQQRRRVTVTDRQTVTIDITLEPSTSVLNEVVVTGTVVATERKAIPTPITVIKAEDIQKRGITRIEQLFRGEVPGLLVKEAGSQVYGNTLGVMASSTVYSRGSASLDGSANPIKTYIDGVELLDPSYLGTIDPQSIDRIEIITGPQAATIYGSGAMGGVMQIFTKKGSGRTVPDVTASVKYGMLQNNETDGLTPAHTDVLNIAGGAGPAFSYAGNVSHNYTGQWQPFQYNRVYGASVGATHMQGAFTGSVSLAATNGKNGTHNTSYARLGSMYLYDAGIRGLSGNPAAFITRLVSTSTSQTVSLNADYRMTPFWQHHLTVGKSQNTFALEPQAPAFAPYDGVGSDTLYRYQQASGSRTTLGYNMTLTTLGASPLSSTLTFGMTSSRASRFQMSGCLATETASSFVGCDGGTVTVTRTLDDDNWGGFGTWQLGVYGRLYFTLGLRGERNPTYGEAHRIDWTPTNGVTYTIEHGDLTLKLLGSYGRATRPPNADYRLAVESGCGSDCEPARYVGQLANPDLRPERSRGPQGGIEVYYGNLGSLTINRYQQTVTDLIQSVRVDSFPYTYFPSDYHGYLGQYQYRNVAKVRQQGWEGTASLSLGLFTIKGTYSWNDSRVLSVSANSYSQYAPGQSFMNLPTHMGSLSFGYARGATSVTMVSNYVGASIIDYYYIPRWVATDNAREPMYVETVSIWRVGRFAMPGYVKSDLAASHRVSSRVTATLNVLNLGNSYGSEVGGMEPTLGRQTTVGLSVRFPDPAKR